MEGLSQRDALVPAIMFPILCSFPQISSLLFSTLLEAQTRSMADQTTTTTSLLLIQYYQKPLGLGDLRR